MLPVRALLGEPGLGLPDRRGLDAAGADPTGFLRCHQPDVDEHLKVLHDRGQRHIEGFSELTDRRGTANQPLDQPTPGRIREGMKDPVQ